MSIAKIIKAPDLSRVKEILYSKYKYKQWEVGRPSKPGRDEFVNAPNAGKRLF